MWTSAKNTLYSEALIFTLEDMWSRIVMKICEKPRFVESSKWSDDFFLKWTGSCQNRSKVTSFST